MSDSIPAAVPNPTLGEVAFVAIKTRDYSDYGDASYWSEKYRNHTHARAKLDYEFQAQAVRSAVLKEVREKLIAFEHNRCNKELKMSELLQELGDE
jgi:hypothetical protein